jgi:integrase
LLTVEEAKILLKAVRTTALDDGAIKRNPCRVKGAGQGDSPERPTLAIAQVYALADATEQRYWALVLRAMFSSLRWGELGGLRRCDIDLTARTVRVTRQLNEVSGGGFEFGPPKSRAGKWSVPIPEVIISIIKCTWPASPSRETKDSSSPARPESRYGTPTSAAGYGSGTQSGRGNGHGTGSKPPEDHPQEPGNRA